MTSFRDLLGSLVQREVQFIIVGGAAAIAHGASRLTQDLDIVYERSTANLDRIVTALMPFSPYLRGVPMGLPFLWERATLQRGLNFTLTTSAGDIDLLGEILAGGSYDEMLQNTVELEVFGFRCRCIDLLLLIQVKRAVGRPKDLEALAELEAISEEKG